MNIKAFLDPVNRLICKNHSKAVAQKSIVLMGLIVTLGNNKSVFYKWLWSDEFDRFLKKSSKGRRSEKYCFKGSDMGRFI